MAKGANALWNGAPGPFRLLPRTFTPFTPKSATPATLRGNFHWADAVGRRVSDVLGKRTLPRHFMLPAVFSERLHCAHASPSSVSASLAPETCQRSAGKQRGPAQKLSRRFQHFPDGPWGLVNANGNWRPGNLCGPPGIAGNQFNEIAPDSGRPVPPCTKVWDRHEGVGRRCCPVEALGEIGTCMCGTFEGRQGGEVDVRAELGRGEDRCQ
eukprot:362486-Chlamydomonas_euryale.AAC.1